MIWLLASYLLMKIIDTGGTYIKGELSPIWMNHIINHISHQLRVRT